MKTAPNRAWCFLYPQRTPAATVWLALALLGSGADALAANWTCRGTLQDAGEPANGRFDLRLTLLDARGLAAVAGPITLYGVVVKNGEFATAVDFGIDLDRAPVLQLQTEVSNSGGTFVALGEPKLFDAKGTPAVCWETHGNLGTNPAIDFIGTVDAQPLKFVVNGLQVGRFSPTGVGPNIVLGNQFNSVLAKFDSSVVMGGRATAATANLAVGSNATILGGFAQVAEREGTVAGGHNNHAAQSAFAAGRWNCAGGFNSMALGQRVRIRRSATPGPVGLADPCDASVGSGDANGDNGTFAWSDDQPSDFVSSGERQFLVRAGGGVLLNTNQLPSPAVDDMVLKARAGGDADVDLRMVTASGKHGSLYLRDGDGAWRLSAANLTGADFLSVTNGARLTAGGAWTNASSRSLKHEFAAVNPETVLERLLALPITTWEYRSSDEGAHMGPVAEDFRAAFGFGSSDRSISTVDADGVALAAIQGLNQRLQQGTAMMRALQDDRPRQRAGCRDHPA